MKAQKGLLLFDIKHQKCLVGVSVFDDLFDLCNETKL